MLPSLVDLQQAAVSDEPLMGGSEKLEELQARFAGFRGTLDGLKLDDELTPEIVASVSDEPLMGGSWIGVMVALGSVVFQMNPGWVEAS